MINAPLSVGWRLVPPVTILLMLGPVAFGLLGTLLPAFGLWRVGSAGVLGVDAFHDLAAVPGLGAAIWLSLKTGLISTALAVGFTLLLLAGWQGTPALNRLERLLSPLLSVPHAAAAFGLAFLIAPSGWLMRLTSPLHGLSRPPDLLLVQDPGGWSLILGLLSKELPFLLLMSLAALPSLRAGLSRVVTLSLGYGRVQGWLLVTAPQLYTQIRLPIYAVLAYAMSTVDMALILGPSLPPTLSVLIVDWMADPDLTLRAQAAAGGLVQLGLVIFAIGLWRFGEGLAWAATRALAERGTRVAGRLDHVLRATGLISGSVLAAIVLLGLLSHAIWAFAGHWRFPDALPEKTSLRVFDRSIGALSDVFTTTLTLAFCTAFLALILTLLCLEVEHRRGRSLSKAALWVLYTPLLIPQIAFLPGLQIGMLGLGAQQGLLPVFLAHLVFVLPYVFLALSGPYRAWDTRLAQSAACLGASPLRVFLSLRLPMLLGPSLVALAVGMAVSVGQYLPTLLMSGGRVNTLTTEALTLAAGGDRRAIGFWALALTAAAWLPFALALALPAFVFRHRQEMRHG